MDPEKLRLLGHGATLVVASYAIYVGGSVASGQGFFDGIVLASVVGAIVFIVTGRVLRRPT